MDFDTILLINEKKSSTKSFIIRIVLLVENININQIKSMLKKDFNKNISYQAIRKVLLELIESEVIIKNDNNTYRINKVWVLQLKEAINIIEKTVSKQKKIKRIDKDTEQITFKNLNDLGYFILFGLENQYFASGKEHKTYIYIEHLWIPFSNPERRDKVKELFTNNNVNILIKNNSLGDKMLSKWYNKCAKVKLNIDMQTPCQYMLRNDCVIQIFMDEELKIKMNNLYKLKGVINLNLFQELIDITNKEYGIEVIITRNKKIADQIKNKIKSYFK